MALAVHSRWVDTPEGERCRQAHRACNSYAPHFLPMRRSSVRWASASNDEQHYDWKDDAEQHRRHREAWASAARAVPRAKAIELPGRTSNATPDAMRSAETTPTSTASSVPVPEPPVPTTTPMAMRVFTSSSAPTITAHPPSIRMLSSVFYDGPRYIASRYTRSNLEVVKQRTDLRSQFR
jgi:hypothetical protein